MPTSIFDELTEEDRREVMQRTAHELQGVCQVVFHEGDLGDTVHLIESGLVAIRRTAVLGDVVTYAVLGAGDTFGELALILPDSERSASVVALLPTRTPPCIGRISRNSAAHTARSIASFSSRWRARCVACRRECSTRITSPPTRGWCATSSSWPKHSEAWRPAPSSRSRRTIWPGSPGHLSNRQQGAARMPGRGPAHAFAGGSQLSTARRSRNTPAEPERAHPALAGERTSKPVLLFFGGSRGNHERDDAPTQESGSERRLSFSFAVGGGKGTGESRSGDSEPAPPDPLPREVHHKTTVRGSRSYGPKRDEAP